MSREDMIALLKQKYPCLAVENEKLFPYQVLMTMVAVLQK